MLARPDRPAWFDAELTAALPDLRHYAWSKFPGERAVADDLMSHAVLRALESWQQFQQDSHFKAWLFRIFINLMLTRYRDLKRRKPADLEELDHGDHGIFVPLPDANLETHRIMEMISQLPKRHRDVLIQICVLGNHYDEAAVALGLPVGTLKSALFRARSELQRRIET